MSEEEFIRFCETFDFSQFPDSYNKFLKKELVVIKRYISKCQLNGDKRTDNDIVMEWVQGKNSALFRVGWVFEYCHVTKLNTGEYIIPERFI